MQENTEWQWSNFTWQNPDVTMGRTVGWRIYYTNIAGNASVTNIMSFSIRNEVWVDDDADSEWYDVCHVHTIHEGITNVGDGGIVHVLSGTYYEHIGVNKQISLIGQDKTSTVIDGNIDTGTCVLITHSYVTVSNFTIRYSRLPHGHLFHWPPPSAIFIVADYTTIANNIITDNDYGIVIYEAAYNTIVGNTIRNTTNNGFETVALLSGTNASWNTIYHNNFINNYVNANDSWQNTWNKEYPVGGNYWSDYTGSDTSPHDGIGDTLYNISVLYNDKDYYPFVQQDGWLLTNPPYQPVRPEGPTTADVGQRCSYIVTDVTDPYNYDVSCWFYWGDNTSSGWTEFKTSGSTFSASHIWSQAGTFNIQVIDKDPLGRASLGSSSLTVIVRETGLPPPPPPPPLSLDSPAYVMEGTAFQVRVTAQGNPIENALISFFNSGARTDSNGVAHLQAPYVNHDTMYIITATHEDFESTTNIITVLYQPPQPQDGGGFVYGTVTDTSGRFLTDAYVSIQLSQFVTLKKFTSNQGYFFLIPAGMYMMEVGKRGYKPTSLTNVAINKSSSTKLDFVLETNPGENPRSPANLQKDLVEAVIETGVFADKVSGELNFALGTKQYNITLYQEQINIKNIQINTTKISFIVNATNLHGTIIALRIYSNTTLSNIRIEYDNQTINQIGFTDMFTLVEGNMTPLYTWIKIARENKTIAYCLIYIPKFSEHGITVYMMKELIESAGGLIVVLSYIVVCAIAGIVFFSPVFIRFIRRVYFQKKK